MSSVDYGPEISLFQDNIFKKALVRWYIYLKYIYNEYCKFIVDFKNPPSHVDLNWISFHTCKELLSCYLKKIFF